MKKSEFSISVATEDDLHGLMFLQQANLVSNGGTLSAALSIDKLTTMIHEMPLIIAKKEDRIVGFLLTANLDRNADIPIVKSMLNVYTGNDSAYLYGPVCVDFEERGKGLAGMMFGELRHQLPKRQGILFIRYDNKPSIEAHIKMGMMLATTFVHDGVTFNVFTYYG